MPFSVAFALIVVATAADGMVLGASLDQSIKQLPSRHAVGLIAYSVYSRVADIRRGALWYALLAEGAALLTLASAAAAIIQRSPLAYTLPLYVATAMAIAHTLVTTQTVPIIFSQRKVSDDAEALARLFQRFENWQTLRATFQAIQLAAMIWAFVAIALR